MKPLKYLILLSIIIMLFINCSSKNKPIATFKGGAVLKKEFDFALNKLPDSQKKNILSSNKKVIHFIKELAIKKIISQWIYTTNIINLSTHSNYIKTKYKEDLFRYVLNEKTSSPEEKVKSSDIKKFTSTLSIKLIWLKTYPGMNKKEYNNIYKKAQLIISLLKKGEDFSKLANKYSSDRNNFLYGKLGAITEKDISKKIFNEIKKLKENQISNILEDSNSYQIIKILKIENVKGEKKYNILRIYIKKNSKNSYKKAEEALNLIKRGFDFGIIANEFTEDKNNFRGGKISPFKYDRIYLKISDAAYELDKGEVSDIIKTRYGFFIIKKENVQYLPEKNLKTLSKNQRFINSIKRIKERYRKNLEQYKLVKKIFKNYNIIFYTSLFTNFSHPQTNEIICKVPQINKTIKYNEVLSILKEVIGPKRSDDIIVKEEEILNKFFFKDIIIDYAKKKEWDQEDNFKLKFDYDVLNRLYNEVIAQLEFNIKVTEKEMQNYYKRNIYQFYVTKVINHQPKRVKLSYEKAKKIVLHKLKNEKRKKLIEKWKENLLKEYNFKIIYENLSLKKDYDYYISKAKEYLNSKNYKKALKYTKKAMKLNSNNIRGYINEYIIYQNLNKIKEAFASLEKIKKLSNINADDLLAEYEKANNELKLKLIDIMGHFPSAKVVNKLIEIYSNSTNANFIEASIRSLGQAKAIEAYEILMHDLKNFDNKFKNFKEKDKEIIKWYLIEALGYIGNNEATPYLISLLKKSKNIDLKCFIIEALGRIKDDRSIPILKKYLKDKVWGIRVLAAESLKNITGKDYKIKPPQKGKEGT